MNLFSVDFYRIFWRNARGVAAIEFAIILPLLLFLAFVGFEFVSFQLARIKVDKAAYLVASAVTQLATTEVKNPAGDTYRMIDDAQLQALLEETDNLLPRNTRGGLKVVVSSFTQITQLNDTLTSTPRNVNAPLLLWARGWRQGTAASGMVSTIPAVGSKISLPKSSQLARVSFTDTNTQNALTRYGGFSCGENVILVETFYEYEPAFKLFADVNLLQRQVMVSRSFLRPRTGDIEALAGNASFATPANIYQITKQRDGFCP